MKIRTLTNIIFIVSITLFSLSASAGKSAIRFSNNAYKQVISTDKSGKKVIDYVKPKLVLPGDVILYAITFKNISKQPVSNIVINNPLPNNTRYRAGSASGNATDITFSVDGKHFGKPETLKIKDKTGQLRSATAKDYTAIRWIYKKTLKPGEKSTVTYKTEIKK